jgi:cyclopropane fatty-acyl-phospholipid synthase-like methyltransferase
MNMNISTLPVQSNNTAVDYVGTVPAEGLAQLDILRKLGCKPAHRVLEIGCGALIAGYPLMQYLMPRCYVGIDPNSWLIGQSLAIRQVADAAARADALFVFRPDFRTGRGLLAGFDFILSHSILSHTSSAQLDAFLAAVADQLNGKGKAAVSIRLAEGNAFGSTGSPVHGEAFTEWQYPGVSWFQQADVVDRARKAGLTARVEPTFTQRILHAHSRAVHDWLVLEHETPLTGPTG